MISFLVLTNPTYDVFVGEYAESDTFSEQMNLARLGESGSA